MTTGTKLPIDRLAAMRVTGPQCEKAERLADETVVKIEVNAKGVSILFQSVDKARHRFVQLVRRDPNRNDWQFDSQVIFNAPPRPVESRTGTPAESGARWQEAVRYSHRRVTGPPPVKERTPREPAKRWDEANPSLMPLDAPTICKALQRLSGGSHKWYYERLIRDHGLDVAKAAYAAGYNLYIKEIAGD